MLATKLNKACYIARVIRPFLSLNSPNIIYHAHFHSVITYSVIFWGTSSHSLNIFKLQKRIVRIPRDSCRTFFKTLKRLPLASKYILSLALFMVTNKTLFRQNFVIHNFNTRNNSNFFQVMTHLTMFQKSPAYAGVKIYNHLPADIKDLACDIKGFKKSIKIVCMTVFILWMSFFMYKIRKVLLMIILISLYFKINNYKIGSIVCNYF
jgi:hypothetical protein